MKLFVVLAVFVASASCNVIRVLKADSYDSYAAPAVRIPITSFTNEIRGSLSNDLSYSTGNGISVSDHTQVLQGRGSQYEDEQGRLVQSDSSLQKTGSFSYTSPEGLPISLSYVSDENGFRAEGAHLPKAVELPAEHAQAHREALARVSNLPSSSYDSYDASAIRLSSYDAPAVRVSSYDAPVVIRKVPTTVRVIAPPPVTTINAY